MSFQDKLFNTINSGIGGIWLNTSDPHEVSITLCTLYSDEIINGKMYVCEWDSHTGAVFMGHEDVSYNFVKDAMTVEPSNEDNTETALESVSPRLRNFIKCGAGSPLRLLNELYTMLYERHTTISRYQKTMESGNEVDAQVQEEVDEATKRFIIVINLANGVYSPNSQTNYVLCQQLLNVLTIAPAAAANVILFAPDGVKPPAEIEHFVQRLDHGLPDQAERVEIVQDLLTCQSVNARMKTQKEAELNAEATDEEASTRAVNVEMSDEDMEEIAGLFSGLNRTQLARAFMITVQEHGKIIPQKVFELKTEIINADKRVIIDTDTADIQDVGGLQGVKEFCLRSLERKHPLVKARGVCLVGVPGVGKSMLAKMIAGVTGRVYVKLDIGSQMASLVGETESRIRQALQIVDAIGDAVLLIDEVDKALGGQSDRDGGATERLKGTLLQWLNDRKSDVYVIMAANSLEKTAIEMTRAGRVDATFFVDVPSEESRNQIWDIWRTRYDVPSDMATPPCKEWTGAEIETCCRLAVLLDVPLEEAAKKIVPIAIRQAEKIGAMRLEAKNAFLDAESGETYDGTRRARRPAEVAANDTMTKASTRAGRRPAKKRTG